VAGRPLDEKAFEPIFATMAVLLHYVDRVLKRRARACPGREAIRVERVVAPNRGVDVQGKESNRQLFSTEGVGGWG